MLIMGETFNQRKAFIWSCIHTCQDLITVLQKVTGENAKLARQIIKDEREIIKSDYATLKELQRWFKQSGLTPDEPYKTPGQIAWEASLTEEQWEDRINKAHVLDQMREKYELERGSNG